MRAMTGRQTGAQVREWYNEEQPFLKLKEKPPRGRLRFFKIVFFKALSSSAVCYQYNQLVPLSRLQPYLSEFPSKHYLIVPSPVF